METLTLVVGADLLLEAVRSQSFDSRSNILAVLGLSGIPSANSEGIVNTV